MSKPLTATQLRADLYRVLDEVLATGKACRVVRDGRVLLIEPETAPKKRLDLAKLRKRRGVFKGSFDDLVRTSWESEWRP